MALLVGRTTGSVLNAATKSLKTATNTIKINRNRLLVSSTQCLPHLDGINCSNDMNNCNFYGNYRSLSTTAAYYDESKVYFTKKHEWVSVVENMGTVGITDYAQQALGDVVYAQLPEVDADVVVGEECGALESVKAASELYSPVTGTVLEKNVAVEDLPALINTSAQNEGWLFKVKLSKSEELEQLLDESSYGEYLKTQEDDH